MTNKSLKTILKEKNYSVRGKEERKKLSESLNEYLSQDNEAVWYWGLANEIAPYIKELNEQGEFPKSNYGKKSLEREIEFQIQKKNGWETPLEEIPEEIKEEISKEYMKNYGKGTARNELESSMKQNSELFGIGNIYSILREFYGLKEGDKVEIGLPVYLFNQDNFRDNLQKAKDIESLKPKKYSNQKGIFENNIKNLKQDEEYIKKNNEEQFNVEEPNYRTGWRKTQQQEFASDYLSLVSRMSIAYKDPKKAIEFFEKETGISLSNPKEYKKVVF
jgi:hypothetical protein